MSENAVPEKASSLLLEVVTPTKIELKQVVDYVVAPTKEGQIGILPGHVGLMTVLDTGVLRYKVAGEDYYMAVSEGYMEVAADKVIVLAEAAELAENIDVERALADKRKAEAALRQPLVEKISFARTRVSLQRALTRLQVVKKYGTKEKK